MNELQVRKGIHNEEENVLEEKLNIIEWCQTLQRVPDDIWFQALRRVHGQLQM